MSVAAAMNRLKASSAVTWKSSGFLQRTLKKCVEVSGKGLHSGEVTSVRLVPEMPGKGRYFSFGENVIPACIEFVEEALLCTTLCKDGYRVKMVEHLLSALEVMGVNNCRIEINGAKSSERTLEVPILDGSAREWVQVIDRAGLDVARDQAGARIKEAPYLNEPVHVFRGNAFVSAYPSTSFQATYGIDFPQAPLIGRQWFSTGFLDKEFYSKEIASARTFCVYEEVEKMLSAGLIKGGSKENAIICSSAKGWITPNLRFIDEPCRHKVLDLIGDLSLLASGGSQGLPAMVIVAYKAGHALHAEFVRRLSQVSEKNSQP